MMMTTRHDSLMAECRITHTHTKSKQKHGHERATGRGRHIMKSTRGTAQHSTPAAFFSHSCVQETSVAIQLVPLTHALVRETRKHAITRARKQTNMQPCKRWEAKGGHYDWNPDGDTAKNGAPDASAESISKHFFSD